MLTRLQAQCILLQWTFILFQEFIFLLNDNIPDLITIELVEYVNVALTMMFEGFSIFL